MSHKHPARPEPPAVLKGKGLARREEGSAAPAPGPSPISSDNSRARTGPPPAAAPLAKAHATPVILKPAAPARKEEHKPAAVASSHLPVKPLETGKLIPTHLEHVLLDPISKLLTDNADFTVVAGIGAEGAGKSLVMNELARPDGFSRSTSMAHQLPELFPQWTDNDEWALTRGVDFALRLEDRSVWLDSQALQSASVLASALSAVAAAPAAADEADATNERTSLELVAALAGSCHALVLVDGPHGPSLPLFRFLRAARMLSPPAEAIEQSPGHSAQEIRWPPIVYVLNRGEDRSPYELEAMANAIRQLLGPPAVRVDAVVLPHRSFVSPDQYITAVRRLRQVVATAATAGQAVGGSLVAGRSEREWLRIVTRALAATRGSNLIAEYCKLAVRPPTK